MNDKLDERQVYNRNRIGNQCFLLTACLLLADVILSLAGIQLPYRIDIYIVLCAITFFYIIRLIVSGAYTGSRAKSKTAFAVVSAATPVIAVTFLFRTRLFGVTAGSSWNLLFIISSLALAAAIVVLLIRSRPDKKGIK